MWYHIWEGGERIFNDERFDLMFPCQNGCYKVERKKLLWLGSDLQGQWLRRLQSIDHRGSRKRRQTGQRRQRGTVPMVISKSLDRRGHSSAPSVNLFANLQNLIINNPCRRSSEERTLLRRRALRQPISNAKMLGAL